jgi:hypothetical protein
MGRFKWALRLLPLYWRCFAVVAIVAPSTNMISVRVNKRACIFLLNCRFTNARRNDFKRIYPRDSSLLFGFHNYSLLYIYIYIYIYRERERENLMRIGVERIRGSQWNCGIRILEDSFSLPIGRNLIETITLMQSYLNAIQFPIVTQLY